MTFAASGGANNSAASNLTPSALRRSIFLAGASALAMTMGTAAMADGGDGGDNRYTPDNGGQGGVSSNNAPGGNGTEGLSGSVSGGGGGGGGSGSVGGHGGEGFGGVAGGAGGANPGEDGEAGGRVPLGSDRYSPSGGGGGGGGAHGRVESYLSDVSGTISGGNGGAGGDSNADFTTGGAGGGGAGGYGVVSTSSDRMIDVGASAQIIGGNGGKGGNADNGDGGSGGDGGIGFFLGNGSNIANSGTITGGDGGTLGVSYTSGGLPTGATGAGGAGIVGSGLTIYNSGSISGGQAGNNGAQANAITFGGTGNVYQHRAGGSVLGNVVGTGSDAFELGGSANGSFNVSQFGSTFQGFSTFDKLGSSAFALTGTTSQVTPWTIRAGTLAIASDSALGANSGALTFNGSGTVLRIDGTVNSSRNISLASSGIIDTNGNAASIAGTISGGGALIKSGAGTLTLSASNAYTGSTEIDGGTLSISSDANLGTGGALVLSGGTLATTASFDTSRAVSMTDDSTISAATGTELTLSGSIAGDGDLVMAGPGRLVLTGDNDYGNTIVKQGVVRGDAGALSGNIANASEVIFAQTDNAIFSGDIAGYDGVNGTMQKQGAGDLTLAAMSSLDWTVDEGRLISMSDRFGGDVALGIEGGFAFDQSFAGSYDGQLSGTGAFSVTGGGFVELTADNSGFAGSTQVVGSTLAINDMLGGSLMVGNGGNLQGSGEIGSGSGSTVTIASGGTLAPGNSIGTLNVNGDLTFQAGSRYEVEVAPGGTDSDRVAVTGTATLAGSVAHIGVTGTYDQVSTYTILTAGAGIAGIFEGVTSDLAFLDPTLGYGANAVTLTLARNDIGFADMGATANQRATAVGLDTLGSGNSLYDAIVQLDAATARSAFDQLSGEVHASVMTGLVEDSRHVRDAATTRILDAFGGVGSSRAPVAAYGPNGPVTAPADSDLGMAVWSSAFGSWGSTDGDGNAAALDRSTGGLFIGADAMLNDTWRLGLLGGYSHSWFQVDDRASSASADNYHLGVYSGAQWDALAFRGGLAYTWHDIEANRSVGFTGFGDNLASGYNAGTFQAFGELGYGLEMEFARFEPFANLAHVSVRRDGFAEAGGAASLSAASAGIDTTFTTIGLRADTDILFGVTRGTLHGSVGWRHAFGDVAPDQTLSLVGSDAFTIAGVPVARDAAVIEAGLDLELTDHATLGISYNGQFGSGIQDHSFAARIGISF